METIELIKAFKEVIIAVIANGTILYVALRSKKPPTDKQSI